MEFVNFLTVPDVTNSQEIKTRPASQAGDFVTVIEVNGLKAAEKALKKAEEKPQQGDISPGDAATSISKKKVPPK